MKSVRIATRKSPLAVWQAEHVAQSLRAAHPGLGVELVHMSTRGDVMLDSPLSKVGGKGLFVKELEHGILCGRADLAVHSMKDVPVDFPPGLHLAAVLPREDPRDALVSEAYRDFRALPPGARVGTCSLRRQCQLRGLRPDLQTIDLRGNVNTRLAKLDAGQFDAIVLAAAGLTRLGLDGRIGSYLEPEVCLPAIGQGAIGVECRSEDAVVNRLLAPLDDRLTRVRVTAERAVNARLGGSCQVPVAGYAELRGSRLWLRALVGRPDGSQLVRGEVSGPGEEAAALGRQLGDELLNRGGGEILRSLLEPS